MLRKVKKPPKTEAKIAAAPAGASRFFSHSRWAEMAWMVPYVAALVWWRDRVPSGLNNDAVEEALRGIYLLEQHKFEVMTFAIGNSAETLYLYLSGLMVKLFGPTTFAIYLPSWIFAVVFIWLMCRMSRRLDGSTPTWVPLTLAVSSVWLFHYARSGLRAITSPFFLVGFWLLLDRAERAKEPRWISLAAGAMLGLSLYSYTSCRVLPIIFLLYAGLRVLQDRQNRSGLLGCYGYTLAGAFIFSIPNLIFLVRFPQEFLFRGSYSIPQEAGLKITGLVWSFLFPFFYPSHLTSEFYQRVFEVDSVSNGLVVAGISPIHIIVAFAFLTGLARACRDWRESGAAFLLISWSAGTIILGIGGPSLTRLLILLPVYLLLATLGFAEGLKRLPGYRWVFVALLALVVVSHGYRYFYEVGSSPHAKFYASAVATPMGERAAVLAAAGRRVVCVVFKDANVIRYLTRSHGSNVQVAEFYFRPLVLREIPLEEFKPEILLIERTPEFVRLSAIFRQNLVATNELFDEIHLPVSR